MKKTTLLSMLLLASVLTLFGQETSTKNWLIGGSTNFFASKTNQEEGAFSQLESKQSGFSLNPYFGKYFSDKWIIGLDAGFSREVEKRPLSFNSSIERKNTLTSFSMGVFARYLVNPNNKLVFQLAPIIQFTHSVLKEDDGSQEDKLNGISFGAGAGPLVSYALSPKVNLVGRFGTIQFVAGNWKEDDGDDKRTFTLFQANFNIRSIGIGLEVNI